MRFQDQVMVITGAAQGIGRRVAERAAAEGGRMVLVDRADIVHEVVAGIVEQGGEAIAVQAD
ncbi:MAG: SDR family NAD(P)-dependent oxidoreductase, partial [Pseudomonadota bacterium]|nr:SDR family NAD(P)-dependent oxidoreductase [Pseudomonadota bacterium]